jgi:hypothetical protein
MEHEDFVNLLKTAGDAGSLHSKFYLATMYKQALGTEQNYEKAIKYYLQCLDDTTTEDNLRPPCNLAPFSHNSNNTHK